MTPRPRVALVHDYLTQLGGAERVVVELARAFPDAPLFTSLYDPDRTYPEFRTIDVRTTPLDHIPFLRRHHRAAFPALALAFSSLRIDADVVVCSSSGWAHGVRTTGAKIVYCHAVARWLTQPDRYLCDARNRWRRLGLTASAPMLTRWDARAAASADRYLANSEVTKRAIGTRYGIDAEVVHPPVRPWTEVPRAVPGVAPGYFLCVSRLLPYKNVRALCDAFARMPTMRLVVVGDGPDAAELRASAPRNVSFHRSLDDAELRWCYDQCIALVTASYEDFGLTVLEAAAAGRPAVALRAGGFLETVVEGATGMFFDSLEPEAIACAIRAAHDHPWDARRIEAHARTFAPERYAERMREVVEEEGGRRARSR